MGHRFSGHFCCRLHVRQDNRRAGTAGHNARDVLPNSSFVLLAINQQIVWEEELEKYNNSDIGRGRKLYTPLKRKSNQWLLKKKNKWAVIIGIAEYYHSTNNGLPNLLFADDDARAFAHTLHKLGWSSSHMKLLINEQATQRNIMIALKSWLTKAGPDDQVILFWAGHGYPDPEDMEIQTVDSCGNRKGHRPPLPK